MLGPLPVCTWLDGVLSKNGMILSRRDGFASYFKFTLILNVHVCLRRTHGRLRKTLANKDKINGYLSRSSAIPAILKEIGVEV